MTQWVEEPIGGRDRGPAALARSWLEVLVRPGRFFETGVAPGDQAPGLVFAVSVLTIEQATRFALVPDSYPTVAGRPLVSAVLVLAAIALLVAPLLLHLLAAFQTVLLVILVDDRAGTGETVQVLAYAIAPCLFAGIPVAPLGVLCGAFGWVLLVLGMARVHRIALWRSAIVTAVPGLLVFGYGFGAIADATTTIAWLV